MQGVDQSLLCVPHNPLLPSCPPSCPWWLQGLTFTYNKEEQVLKVTGSYTMMK
jgi:hypothetical protein